MTRSRALTATLGMGAAAVSLALAGCGVQTTGVNVASTQPITPSQTPPQTATPTSAGKFTYVLYFVGNPDSLAPVVRHSQKQLSDTDILEQLALGPTSEEIQEGYVNRMPDNAGLAIAPTGNQGQQYFVKLPSEDFVNIALGQLTCTLSAYWQTLNPDNDSVQLLFPDLPTGSGASHWRDCASYGGPGTGDAAAPNVPASAGDPGSVDGLVLPAAPSTSAGR